MLLAHSKDLADEIARDIRDLMREDWYQTVFATRLAPDRQGAMNFKTKSGGGVFASYILGAITGRGADWVFIDDPLHQADFDDLELVAKINRTYATVVCNRLNNPSTGKIVLVAHRLNDDDLSGFMLSEELCSAITLPLIAPKTQRYETDTDIWLRKKGEVLRPKEYPRREVERVRNLQGGADFELFYQQAATAQTTVTIRRQDFGTFNMGKVPDGPTVISVDPGAAEGLGASYSVVQVWRYSRGQHHLIDQWRERAAHNELRSAILSRTRKYLPSAT